MIRHQRGEYQGSWKSTTGSGGDDLVNNYNPYEPSPAILEKQREVAYRLQLCPYVDIENEIGYDRTTKRMTSFLVCRNYCKYWEQCNYAHDFRELQPEWCFDQYSCHNPNCNRVHPGNIPPLSEIVESALQKHEARRSKRNKAKKSKKNGGGENNNNNRGLNSSSSSSSSYSSSSLSFSTKRPRETGPGSSPEPEPAGLPSPSPPPYSFK